MKKLDLIDKIGARASGTLTKTDIAATVDALFGVIGDELAAGRDLTLTGFGNFQIKTRPAREGRNPRTGETIAVAAKKTVRFKAHKGLVDKLG